MPDPAPPHPDDDGEERDPLFETLWRRVVEAWDDDRTHKALLEYAVRAEQLAEAAGRYRAMQDDPSKRDRAKRQMDTIVATATQMMLAMKTPPPPGSPRVLSWVVGAVSAAVILWVAHVILRR